MKKRSIEESFEEEEKLNNFYKWLKENGAQFEKIDIYSEKSTGMRGIYALDDVEINENLIYIPEKLIIFCEKIQGNVVAKKLRKYFDKIKDYETLILSLFVIEEAYNPDSFWKPFIDILPTDLSNFPIFYTDEELSLLKGYRMYNQIIKMRNKLRKYYVEMICPEAENEFQVDYCSVVSYDFFLWAIVNVKSRAFGFSHNRLEKAAISPLSDLINHTYNDPKFLWRFSSNLNGFVIFSFMDDHKTSEIFTYYGNIGNEWLLLNYGFLLDNNPFDDIYIRLTLPLDDKDYYLKFVLLEKKGIKSSTKMALSKDLESSKTSNFLSIFRFMHYQDDLNRYLDIQYDLQNSSVASSYSYKARNIKKITVNALKVDYLQNNNKDNEEYNFNPLLFNSIDIDEEVYMLKQFKELLSEILNNFPSNIEEDENFLQNSGNIISENIRNIYKYRISQKKILTFYLNFCDKMSYLFEMDYKTFKEYYKLKKNELIDFDYYIGNTVKYLLSIYKSD